MISPACYSSESSTWSSPPDLVALLAEELGAFELDPAASDLHHCAPHYYTPETWGVGGRGMPWWGRVWLNPPWSRAEQLPIAPWLRKAAESAEAGDVELVCGLIPARTDTSWFHRWAGRAAEIRLIAGRLKYGVGANSAPFPSAIVIWRPGTTGEPKIKLWKAER